MSWGQFQAQAYVSGRRRQSPEARCRSMNKRSGGFPIAIGPVCSSVPDDSGYHGRPSPARRCGFINI